MAGLGSLFVELVATVDPFIADLKAAQKEADETTKHFKPITEALKEMGEAMSVVGDVVAGAMAEMTIKTAEYGAELEHLHERSGVGVDDLAKLSYAASQNGSSMEGLGNSLKFLSKNMELASEGSAGQVQAFASLGISAEQVAATHGDAAAMFALVADKIQGMEDPSTHAADLTKILGKSWTELIPTLKLGSDGLQAAGEQAQSLGLVMSDDVTKQGLVLEQTMKQVTAAAEGVGIAIGTALMPMLTQFAEYLRDGAKYIADFARSHEDWTKAIFETAAAIGVGGALFLGLAAVLTILPQLQAAWAALTLAVSASTLGLGAALAAVIYFRKEIAEGLMAAFSEALGALSDFIGGAAAVADKLGLTGLGGKLHDAAFSTGEFSQELEDSVTLMMTNVIPAVTQGTAVHKAHSEAVDMLTAAQKKLQASIAAMVDSVTEETKKGAVLVGALDQMTNAHTNASLIVDKLSKQILAYYDALVKEGQAVDAVTQYYADLVLNKEALDSENARAFEMWSKVGAIIEKNTASIQGYLQAQATENIKAVDQAWQNHFKNLDEMMNATLEIYKGIDQAEAILDKNRMAAIEQAAKDATAYAKAVFDEGAKAGGAFFDDITTKGQTVFQALIGQLKGGALSIGKSIFEDISGALVGPIMDAFNTFFKNLLASTINPFIKNLAGSLGGGIASLFGAGGGGSGSGGSAVGAAGGIAGLAGGAGGIAGLFSSGVGIPGVAGAAGIDTGAGALSGLGPLLTNPWTIGIAGAIAGTYALFELFKNQAHHTADDFVQQFQDPFGKALAALVDAKDAAFNAGQLTADQALLAKQNVVDLWNTFQTQANQFASQGSKQALVVQQAFATLNPIIANILNGFDGQIAKLQTDATAAAAAQTTAVTAAAAASTTAFNAIFSSIQHFTSSMQTVTEAPGTPGGTAQLTNGSGTGQLHQHWEDAIGPGGFGVSRTLVTDPDGWTPAQGAVLPGHYLEAPITPSINTFGATAAAPSGATAQQQQQNSGPVTIIMNIDGKTFARLTAPSFYALTRDEGVQLIGTK